MIERRRVIKIQRFLSHVSLYVDTISRYGPSTLSGNFETTISRVRFKH